MKFETLKDRKYFFYVLIVGVILLITVILSTSLAKYKVKESINIASGTINYSPSDLNLMGIYIESDNGYTQSDTIPESGYTLNQEESYCKVGDTEQDVTINYDFENQALSITPMTSKGLKCYLYFDEIKGQTVDSILATKTISTRTDFSTVLTTDTTGTIYSATDDDGTSYYYAGAPTDNWVKFAGFYWRIIRFNGDGTIRMIYQGINPSDIGQIGTSVFNSEYNDNAYVGYMYTSGNVHGTSSDTTIKGILDNWYISVLSDYNEYLEENVGFCGDRTPYTDISGSITGGGTGTTTTYYAGYVRLITNKAPTLKCTNNSDLFTASNATNGNKALTYPIGLITADEVAYAGGVNGADNISYYLYTGNQFWSISPYNYPRASIFAVNESGELYGSYNGNSFGARPVINLKADVKLKGDGTDSNPYTIIGASEPKPQTTTSILAGMTKSTRTDFSAVLTTSTTKTVYSAEDDDGTSYYYAGAPTDNWVKFADLYWRIIRINGDGTIRLIYSGTNASTTGSGTQYTKSKFNDNYDNNMYVGFMYTSGSVHGSGTKSTILDSLETFYTSYLASYTEYIDINAGFCGDRTPSTSNTTQNGSGGTGTTITYYGPYIRRNVTHVPTLKCENSSDLYTISSSSKGNKALTYPVGLITMDEVGYAGGDMNAYTHNTTYYLYTGQDYWTLSPFSHGNGGAFVLYVSSSGGTIGHSNVTISAGVRPVINLKADIEFKAGTLGTAENPYEVV